MLWWLIPIIIIGYLGIAFMVGAFIGLMIRERDKHKR